MADLLEQLFSVIWEEEIVPRQWREGLIVNPRHACAARVTVVILCVCVCVCLYVCLSAHAILAARAIKSTYNERYHRVKRQICSNIKMAFSFKLSYSKVRAFFTYLGRGGHL